MPEQYPDSMFAGDWDWDPQRERYVVVYGAVRFGEPWNGSATPVVARGVMDAIAERQRQLMPGDDEVDRLSWVDDRVRVQRVDEAVFWIEPDAEGNYDLAPLGYVWAVVEPDVATDVVVTAG
ncbi:hypothetical protein AB0H36_27675 [Kribbella sp. NPDC050820]|uniref:hypothetical protein n=1 Tax=Kribbella sp. NPDC050820 TaxID=3155408 RepID=UPI0033F58BC7